MKVREWGERPATVCLSAPLKAADKVGPVDSLYIMSIRGSRHPISPFNFHCPFHRSPGHASLIWEMKTSKGTRAHLKLTNIGRMPQPRALTGLSGAPALCLTTGVTALASYQLQKHLAARHYLKSLTFG